MSERRIVVSGRSIHLRRIFFLVRRFKPEAYYYGAMLLTRSLLLCIVPIAFRDKAAAQVLLFSALLTVFVFLQSMIYPWRGLSSSTAVVFAESFIRRDFRPCLSPCHIPLRSPPIPCHRASMMMQPVLCNRACCRCHCQHVGYVHLTCHDPDSDVWRIEHQSTGCAGTLSLLSCSLKSSHRFIAQLKAWIVACLLYPPRWRARPEPLPPQKPCMHARSRSRKARALGE